MVSRRNILGGAAAALVLRPVDAAAFDPASMIRQPLLLSSLYRLPVSKDFREDGAAGANRDGYHWIEEQRQGAEWILRGQAQNNTDWIALGWRELDWGLAQQQSDGGFASGDPFHSTSFFVEALSRACLLDPAMATDGRVAALSKAAQWLVRPEVEGKGRKGNLPYTHRRYILAAAFGEAGAVTGKADFSRKAEAWAREGLALQLSDGTNPERGGFDAGYQMVGVLMALRYLAVCGDTDIARAIKAMVRRAVPLELVRLGSDGAIDPTGSTRIEIEKGRSGKIKDVPYGEVLQAFVYGAEALPEPSWLEPAERIARFRHWLK